MPLLVREVRGAHLDDGFAVLGRVLRVEDFFHFLQRAVFGFHEEEIDDSAQRGPRVSERSRGYEWMRWICGSGKTYANSKQSQKTKKT